MAKVKATTASGEGDSSDWTTLSALKIERATIAKLDAWIEMQNQGRRGPKLSRNDLIRGLLDWAGDTHPDWEARPKMPPGGKARP